jgi:glyoxylase-like metal-dependent hydrolase (beta-lactamase superfamily II)
MSMHVLDKYTAKPVRCLNAARAAVLLLGIWAVTPGAAQQPAGASARNPDAPQADIKIQRIRQNVFMLVGDGANITVQTEPPATEESFDSAFGGDRGVLIVDSGVAGMSGQLLATVRRLSSGPIRYLINTSADPDHVGGNEAIGKAMGGLARGANEAGRPNSTPLMILAHETVLARVSAPSGKQAALPVEAWPTDVFTTDKEAFLNGGSTKIMHVSGAHTDGDSIVYLRRSDVISAGAIFSTTGFPVINAAEGGHIQGILDGLNRILEVAIPGEKEQGGTMIVPAHGRLSDEADVEFYREMVQIIHDRILDGIKNGRTLEQIQAAKPALEYDGRYSQPSWTAEMFVEAVYRDLSKGSKTSPGAQRTDAGRAKQAGK